ncbi:Yippee/Mis18 [Syncephalastrum racemosum]|uniref:Protein yippee-like n=1 Tax=Syncephalastrum racemosum TaxID=13706 RepID=A0A1X2HGV6_SYNRA|nr:Yippee/Mis18 [Syncephalastrum racemosum]
MGLKYRTYLDGTLIYGCRRCKTHLSTGDAIISKHFQGSHGQAYLFGYCVNFIAGKAEDRSMTTGLHRVQDIACIKCREVLGWTYVKAYSEENKYKEGKFILEKDLLTDVR